MKNNPILAPKKILRIWKAPTGLYHIWPDDYPTLFEGGRGYRTKAAAIRAAKEDWGYMGFTHITGSGTYRPHGLTRLKKEER